MSNINDALVAAVAIQEGIGLDIPPTPNFPTRVTYAQPYMQRSATQVNCPFFVNNVEGGPTDFLATGVLQHVSSVIKMYLMVMGWEASVTLAGTLEYTLRWRDAVFAAFAMNLRLGGLDFMVEAHIVGWNIERVEYGDEVFAALVFDLDISEAFPLSVGS